VHRFVLNATDTPFFGYETEGGAASRYASLLNWFHAWRFVDTRLHHQAAVASRQELLGMVGVLRTHWRDDWSRIKQDVVVHGLCMLGSQAPGSVMRQMSERQIALFLSPMGWGPGATGEIIRRIAGWQSAPIVDVLGGEACRCGGASINTLEHLYRQGQLGTLVLPSPVGALAHLNAWAIGLRIPVCYVRAEANSRSLEHEYGSERAASFC